MLNVRDPDFIRSNMRVAAVVGNKITSFVHRETYSSFTKKKKPEWKR
jgi:hypothetical protein